MQRNKFLLGGLLILAAVVYLIVSSTQANAEYFMTINELNEKGQKVAGKSLRVVAMRAALDGRQLSFLEEELPADPVRSETRW